MRKKLESKEAYILGMCLPRNRPGTDPNGPYFLAYLERYNTVHKKELIHWFQRIIQIQASKKYKSKQKSMSLPF